MLRRPFTHPFTLLSAASLVLCAATCGLWVRSYWRGDAWNWGTRTGRAGVASLQGRLILGRVTVSPAALANIPRGQVIESAPAAEAARTTARPGWSFATLQATRVQLAGFAVVEDVRVPYWLLAVATGVLPGLWFRRRSRARRIRPLGLCPACGYDLRATPVEGGALLDRCPECGGVSGARIPT